MFKDMVNKLNEIEQEIKDLKRDKAQAEHLLALVMSHIGELEVDMTNLYKVDFEKVKLLPSKEDRMKVKVFYEKE